MKNTFIFRTIYDFFFQKKVSYLTLFFSVLALSFTKAQQANVGTNLDNGTPWVNGSMPAFTVVSSTDEAGLGTWCSGIIPCNSTEPRGIDSNLGQPAVGTIAGIGSVTYRVTDATNTYNAGNFAGFKIGSPRLGVGIGSIIIRTYKRDGNGDEQLAESKTFTSLELFLDNGGAYEVGFVTTLAYDAIEISHSSIIIGTSTLNVYHAINKRYVAVATLGCNTPTLISHTDYPTDINLNRTGGGGLSISYVNNAEAAVSSSNTDYAELVNVLGIAGSASIAVKDQVTDYPAGTFAGFEIQNVTLLSATVFPNITIETYLTGSNTVVDTYNYSGSAIGATLFGNSGKSILGLVATGAFDEVRISVNMPGGASLSTTRVYGAILTKFCAQSFACNELTPRVNATLPGNTGAPVYIKSERTGFTGAACVNCSITNTQAVIDNNPANSTIINMVGSVVSTGNLSVANTLDTYPKGSFAGFDIESSTLLSASLFGSINISLWNNGTKVQDGVSNSLLTSATTDLLGSENRQIVGIIAKEDFDEVQLSINSLVGVSIGQVKVFGMYTQPACAVPAPCFTKTNLNNPGSSVVINADNTGFTGGVCAACTINNAWNAVSASTTDFARITNTAGVLVDASLSVASTANTFPAGTFAGFTIKRNSFIVSADVFPSITITTYLDGVEQESETNTDLIDLSVIVQIFGNNAEDFFNPGFYATIPFDEVKITIGTLVGALNTYVDVYGAFVDTKFSVNDGSLACSSDTDNDLIPDTVDLDDDNDGILDTVEAAQNGGDTDGDGIPNRIDLDSDNDGITDLEESGNPLAVGADTNGDGSIGNTESPSGTNGVPLIVEGTEGGSVAAPVDTDSDGHPDPYDLDSDNDSINDLTEGGSADLEDANSDGVVDAGDADFDGIQDSADASDGTFGDPDITDIPFDTDGDGIADFRDLDSDNDGINDLLESGVAGAIDAGPDGRVDGPDTDNDGIMDTVDSNDALFGDPEVDIPNNTDPDTVPDYRDLDSDNDGIHDVIEADGTDANGDSMADGAINPTNGVPSTAGTGLTPPNTDGTGGADPYDVDSDGDTIFDLIEEGLNPIYDTDSDGDLDGTADADGDGILDHLDYVDSNYGNQPCLMSIGGGIYNDTDGMANGVNGGQVSGLGTSVQIEISLVKGNTIVAHTSVGTDGKYLLTNVAHGNYKLVLGTNSNGSTTPEMPTGWAVTGEGGHSIGDGTPDGKTNIIADCNIISYEQLRVAATANYLNNNFGIKLAGPLSANLLSFNANQLSEIVNLAWKTSEEKDFSHFELERSTNAKEFGSIGQVNGTKAPIYNYLDNNPAEGINYYRLKMVDLDGKFELSKVVQVNFEKESQFASIENPATNGEVKVFTNIANPEFKVLTSRGVSINFEPIKSRENNYVLKISNPVSGIYFLNIVSNGKVITKKLILP